MKKVTFPVVSATDNDYWQAFKQVATDLNQTFGRLVFTYASEDPLEIPQGEDPEQNTELQSMLREGAKVFKTLHLSLSNGRYLVIERNYQKPFDEFHCHPSPQGDSDRASFALFVGACQKKGGGRGARINPILTEDRDQFYQVQEVAIERLTTALANVGRELEETRKRLTAEFEDREKKLLETYETKNNQLDHKYEAKDSQLEQKALKATEDLEATKKQLEEDKKKLDDRNATHARREKQTEIDTLLGSLEKEFKVSDATARKGYAVVIAYLVAIIAVDVAAFYFLKQIGEVAPDATNVVWFAVASNAVKAVAFTAVGVSLMYMLISWLNHWFQRHAQEEFRLKRLRVDVKRSIWFVETAREWADTKGAAMPNELINRLTTNLFEDGTHSGHNEQPMDALAQVLLGGSNIKLQLPGGSAEIDRKGIKQIGKGDE